MNSILTNEAGRRLELGEQLGIAGGEGRVFALVRKPNQVAKIYHSPPDTSTISKLKWMIGNPPQDVPTEGQSPALSWPESLIFNESNRVVGFVMPFIQSWDLGRLMYPRLRHSLRTSTSRAFDWKDIHTVARNLAMVVSACHRVGYVIGDLNYNNVRVRDDGSVALIDTDSFQVQSTLNGVAQIHHSTKVFRGFTPPELFGKDLRTTVREPHSDLFVLAALIFQLLQDSHHPFQGVRPGEDAIEPESLIRSHQYPYDTQRPAKDLLVPPGAPPYGRIHPGLRNLFQSCFGTGLARPSLRPTARQWVDALDQARADVKRCKHGHLFSAHAATAVCLAISADRLSICGATTSHKPQRGIPLSQVDLLAGTTSVSMQPQRAQVFQAQQANPQTPTTGSPGTSITPGARQGANVAPATPSSSRSRVASALILLVILAMILRTTGGPTLWGIVDDQPLSSGGNTSEMTDANRAELPDQGHVLADDNADTHTEEELPTENIESRAAANRDLQGDGTIEQPSDTETLEASETGLPHPQARGDVVLSALNGQSWSVQALELSSGDVTTISAGHVDDPVPTVSFDGGQIAFVQRAQGEVAQTLRIVDAVTLADIAAHPLRQGMTVTRLAFESDSFGLLMSVNDEHGPHVYRIDLSTGEIAQFLAPQSWSLEASSTGDTAYIVPDGDDESIVRADSLGNADIFLGREFRCQSSPAYSPTGDRVAFVFDACGETAPGIGVWTNEDLYSVADSVSFVPESNLVVEWSPDEDSLLITNCDAVGCRLLIIPDIINGADHGEIVEIPVDAEWIGSVSWANRVGDD